MCEFHSVSRICLKFIIIPNLAVFLVSKVLSYYSVKLKTIPTCTVIKMRKKET